MMSEQEAASLLKAIENIGITVWIDGGWGVDALVGKQTRPHNDIDLFVETTNEKLFEEFLLNMGYSEVPAEYTAEGHTCWRDQSQRVIDLHIFEFKDAQTLRFAGEDYPADLLGGHGTIGGMAVRCLTAEAQVLYHQGYEHTNKDLLDVRLLCETFGINIPEEYQHMGDR